MQISVASRLVGGKYRIRTCEGCYTLAVFETAAFSRSANFPSSKRVRKNTFFFDMHGRLFYHHYSEDVFC